MNLQELRKIIERKKGHRKEIQNLIGDLKRDIKLAKERLEIIEEAQVIIKEVAQETQKQLEHRVSEIVTLALSTVFGETAYEFGMRFVPKRGKTEAELFFVKNGREVEPDDVGGGVINIASFALRVALWSIQSPRSDNVMEFDEPFKDLSEEYRPAACEVLRMLSAELGLQIIMVTHERDLVDTADRVFETYIENGISSVTVKKGE